MLRTIDAAGAMSYNRHRKGAVGRRSAPTGLNEKTRLNLSGAGGFSYAFKTMRMNSVTKSNAIKSFIVMGNAPFADLSKKQAQRARLIGK